MDRRMFRERATKNSLRAHFLKSLLRNIEYRCTSPKDKRFKHYGGRGIRALLTLEDLEFLYERDRPDLMMRPSIDRIENDDHYTRDNCRFIELIDNIKRSQRRQYPCMKCGVVAKLHKMRDQTLCFSCAIDHRFRTTQFVQYVRIIIDEAARRGVPVAGVPYGHVQVNRHRLFINGHSVNVHYAAAATRTNPNGPRYWRLYVRNSADFHFVVARQAKRFFIFIVPGHLVAGQFYIPCETRTTTKGRTGKIDWSAYRDAWHLLQTQTQPESEVA